MAHTSSSLPPTSGSNSAFLRRYEFTYTGGSQLITLPSDYNKVYTIDVEGQGSLSESQYVLIPKNKIEILDELDIDDYIVVLYQEDSAAAGASYSKSETDSLLALKEDLTNKQDSLVFDGTGFKYPTIDVINEALVRNTRLFARTGIVDKSDNFELTILDTNTIRIKACDNVLFWDKLLQSNISVEEAFKSFPVKDYALTELVTATGGNINTNPITTDGIYVRYLGYDINGNVVSSPSSFVENSSVAQLGFTTVIKTGASILFLGGVTTNGRNIFSQPVLANLNDLDRITVTSATDITVNYNIGTPSLNSTNGIITGISINWRGTNNPNNTSPIDKFSYIGDNILDFVSLTPTSLNQATPFTIHTLWTETEDGIPINESFFNTTTQLRDTLDIGSFGIKRVMIGIRGGIFIQESEFPNSSGYATLNEARANVSTHEFTEAILPPGIVIEIARIIFKQGVTDFTNSDEFIITTIQGGGGTSGEPATVPDATTVSKGILKLTGDLGGTADLPTTPTALHKTGNETFTGNKSSTSGTLLITTTTVNTTPIQGGVSSSGGAAIKGTTFNSGSYGVWGASSTGNAIGVYGSNASSNGIAVYGFNDTSSGGAGVAVLANSGASVTNGFNFAGQNNGVNTFTVNKLGDVIANKYTKTGGLTTEFLKANGDVDSTVYAADTNVVHKTGDETITGIKSINNTSLNSSYINGISNSGATEASIVGRANAASTIGIRASAISGASAALKITSNHTGSGASTTPLLLIDNVLTGNDMIPVKITKQGTEVAKIDYLGNTTAASFIKSGVTTTNLLLAGGGDIPQSTFQTALVNPITGSLTTGYLPKATGTNSLGNSLVYDNGTDVQILTSDARLLGGDNNGRFILSNTTTTSYIELDGSSNSTPNKLSLITTNGTIGMFTNGTEKVTVLNNGNVGIGTTSPLGKLQVKTGTNENIGFFSASGRITMTALNDAGTSTIGLNCNATDYIFQISDVEKMRITSSGNVGIGTTTPQAKLNIAGALGSVIGGGGSSIKMTNTDTGNYASISAGLPGWDNAGMDFSTDGVRRMVIGNTGNVGIGTSSPSQKLEVAGNIVAYSGSTGLAILTNQNIQGLGWGTPIVLETSAGGGVLNSNQLYLGSNGNVGIGTTTPSAKLDVSAPVESNGYGLAGYPFLKFSAGDVLDYGAFGATWTALRFMNNGAETMRLTNSNNVGIGTSSPSDKLTVKGSGSNIVSMQYSTDSGGVGLGFLNEAGTELWSIGGGRFVRQDELAISRQGVSALYIDNNRNVGIGTTTIEAKLHIAGDTQVNGNILLGHFGETNYISSREVNQVLTIRGSNYTTFETYNGGWGERMRIANNGTVTINTLAGTGTRVVTADASGVLSASVPQPLVYIGKLNINNTSVALDTVFNQLGGGTPTIASTGSGTASITFPSGSPMTTGKTLVYMGSYGNTEGGSFQITPTQLNVVARVGLTPTTNTYIATIKIEVYSYTI